MALWIVDLYGYGDETASDCVPWFFDSKAEALGYIANATRHGWDWDWVERAVVREVDEY